ncbi:MAG: AraC family transcriptional regulator [Bacteroidales bacterium]
MEQVQAVREVFMGLGSLITVTLFIFVLYILFYLRFNKNLDSESKILLTSLAVNTLFIFFLCIVKHYISEYTTHTYPDGTKYIIAGSVLQLYLPIQIYTLQRSYGYFSKLRDVITLSATVFLLNILLVTISFFIEIEKLIILQYFIQIVIITTILFQCYSLSSSFKEVFSASNENSFSLKGDVFLFITSSAIALLLALSLFTNLTPCKREALKIVLGLINMILIIKVLHKSSAEKLTSLKKSNSGNFFPASNNDFFNQKKEEDLKNRLLNYFETEKPYLNPKLTINEVALYLYSNKTYLSRLINDQYNNNFSQFVNFYRIKVAKELFSKNNQMTIHQLCDLSGFGSMATFTMAFRLYIGSSPAEWCKEQRIKAHNERDEEKE